MLDLVGAVTKQRFMRSAYVGGEIWDMGGPGRMLQFSSVWRAHQSITAMNVHANTDVHYATRWWCTRYAMVSNHTPFRFSALSVSAFCDVFSPVTVLGWRSVSRFVLPASREGFHRLRLKGGEDKRLGERHFVSFPPRL
jgi:hypothetical protein